MRFAEIGCRRDGTLGALRAWPLTPYWWKLRAWRKRVDRNMRALAKLGG